MGVRPLRYNMSGKDIVKLTLFVIFAAAVSSCLPEKEPPTESTWFNLEVHTSGDGFIYSAEALVFGPVPARFSAALSEENERLVRTAFDATLKAINDVNSWASVYREDSAVSILNAAGAGRAVKVPPALIEVLDISRKAHDISEGAFDPTIKPMIDLYRACRKENRLPSAEEREEVLPLIGLKHIKANPDGTVTKDADGVTLDLGGVAKGYGVDRAVDALKAAGISSGLVEIGGDVCAFGTHPDGSPWRVGIVDPRNKSLLALIAAIPPAGEPGGFAMVTSGDYEQVFEVEGRRYTHIFHPETGEPIPCRGAGVSVAAADAATADAIATAFFVMGRERSLAVSEKEGIPVLWLESATDGGIRVTANDRFSRLIIKQKDSENE